MKTDEEYMAEYVSRANILRASRLAWVIDQVDECIREEHSELVVKGRRSHLEYRPYTGQECVQLLDDAIKVAVGGTAAMIGAISAEVGAHDYAD